MRVIIDENTYSEPFQGGNGCGTTYYGQAMDLLLMLGDPPPYYISELIVAPNNNAFIYDSRVGLQKMGRINVKVGGLLYPPSFAVTNIQVNPTGTTNLSGLVNARIYYTTTPVYSEDNIFATSGFGGMLNFTNIVGQVLQPGNNYFWLVYDVNGLAENYDVLVSSFSQVTIRESPAMTSAPYYPPANTSTRVIRGPMSGIYTVGNVPGADYQDLSTAANDVSTLGMMGNVTFQVIGNTTEPEPVKIGQWPNFPPEEEFSLNITPMGNYTINGNFANNGAINLNGCDGVVIGDPTGTYRLGIANNRPSGEAYGIFIQNEPLAPGNGATGNTIINCDIFCGANDGDTQYGIYINSDYNYNNNILNNSFQRAYAGIYAEMPNSGSSQNYIIAGNSFSSPVIENQLNFAGLFLQSFSDVIINNNTFLDVGVGYSFYDAYMGSCNDITFTNNIAHDITTDGYYYCIYAYYGENFFMNNNQFYNLTSTNNGIYCFNFESMEDAVISNNKWYNINCYYSSNYIYYSNNMQFFNNNIHDINSYYEVMGLYFMKVVVII
jgi:hypothetical protein